MTEQELWAANLRAINARLERHLKGARLAVRDADVAFARMRDATLNPAERLAQLEVLVDLGVVK